MRSVHVNNVFAGLTTDCYTCHTSTFLSQPRRSRTWISDGMRLVPHDEPGVDPVDVYARKRDAAIPAGLEAYDGRVRQVPSDRDNYTLYCCQSSGCHNTCAGAADRVRTVFRDAADRGERS